MSPPDAAPATQPLAAPAPVPGTAIPARPPAPMILPALSLDDCDEALIPIILDRMLNRAGKTIGAAALELGVTSEAVRQYIKGRRAPSLWWFLRFARLCGVTVRLEYQPNARR